MSSHMSPSSLPLGDILVRGEGLGKRGTSDIQVRGGGGRLGKRRGRIKSCL